MKKNILILITILSFGISAQSVFAEASQATTTLGAEVASSSVPGFPDVGVAPSIPNTSGNSNVIAWEILGTVLVILVGLLFLKKNKKP